MEKHRKNRYLKVAHFSEAKFRIILKCFCQDLTATQTAFFTKLSRNTINRIFALIRKKIFFLTSKKTRQKGHFELDESYFGAKRIRGKRGRGAAGKTPVFGLLKRDGNVHVEIVKKCSRAQLLPIIKGKILEGSTIHTDGWRAYDGLILNGYKHYRVFHSHNEFARGKCHVNGIESFWAYAKIRLAKFKGMKKENFVFHLKECEFRFNHRQENLYLVILRELRNNPL
ncbi:MAG: IS1595 family transposase [Alphaproteobacteria bacterium]